MPVTPAGLHVPEGREERMRSLNARQGKMESSLRTPQSKALEKELRQLDPCLRVIYVDPEAGRLPPSERAPGVVPGRWHIKRISHPRNLYFSLTGPNWEYREPELAVVEEMKARDLWRRGALEEIRRDEEDEERRRIRQALLEGEQREDEVALAYRAAKRVAGEGGEHRRFDRKRAGEGLTPSKMSASGLLLPSGG